MTRAEKKKDKRPLPGTDKPTVKPVKKITETPGLFKGKEFIFLGVIMIITFIAFFPSLRNGFVLWDDPEYTFENPLLKNFSFSKVFSLSNVYMSNYHPLTILWFYWETIIFPKGSPDIYNGFEPFWFHLNNLLLHLLNTVLVFFVVNELLGRKGWKAAAVTALLFGIHPMHVESVAWVSELKDVLYTAFFLGAAWFYISYTRNKRILYLAFSFILFILSCLSKGQAVILPLLFLLFDYFLGRKYDKTAVLEKVPFFVVALFFGIIAVKAQAAGGGINQNYGLLTSLFYGCYGLLVYLWKFLVPVGLCGIYPYPIDPLKPLPGYFYLLPLVFAPFIFLIYKSLKYSKDYLFGFLFFILAISVTLRFIPLGDTIVAERYTYIPYIGLFFILGQLYSKYSNIPGWNKVAGVILVLVTVVFAAFTRQRTTVWRDSYTFWGDVSEKHPDYWRSYYCLGREYKTAGDYSKALENFTKSCERDVMVPPAPFMHRGAIYINQFHDYDKGIADFLKVLSFPNKADPTQLDARLNLGFAFNKKGEFENAIAVCDEAILINPNATSGYLQKGIALTGQKKYPEAEMAFTSAISLDPAYSEAYFNRGVLYTDHMQVYEKGLADFKKVLEINPQDKNASFNLGVCYLKKKMAREAVEVFSGIAINDPASGNAYALRARAYILENNFIQAYNDLVKAKQLGIMISDQQLNDVKIKAKIFR